MTDTWLPDLDRVSGPKYRAIVDSMRTAIARGTLRDGDRLPPQREVAARLGVDLTTVTRAYDSARHAGLIEPRGRAGSFVLSAKPAVPDVPLIDTGMNMPPELPGGLLRDAIVETSATLLVSGAARLGYQPAGGPLAARIAGAQLIQRAGAPSTPEQVVIAAGGQNALHAIFGALLSPGDAVACGRFVYSGFKALAERMGLRLIPLSSMTAAALDGACAEHPIRALYIVPTNDNPTAVTVTADERVAIAEVARRRDLQLVEDDAYGALAGHSPAPIAAFAPERCWHIASLSKIISPGLRVAFVRAPDVAGALRLAADIHETAIMAPPLNAALVAEWLNDGTFDRLVGAMRIEARSRQTLADTLLGDVPRQRHPDGYHLWLPLENRLTAHALMNAMRGSGLSMVAGDRFAVVPDAEPALRVSLGGAIDRDQLASALAVLHAHLVSPALRAAAPV
jgi:DNA-binding transcriptional MocR family regulator